MPVYNELLNALKAVNANVEPNREIHTATDDGNVIQDGMVVHNVLYLHDDVKNLLKWLRQKDGGQVSVTVARLVSDLDASEQQLNDDKPLQDLVHEVATKFEAIRKQSEVEVVASINNIIKYFNDKLNKILE